MIRAVLDTSVLLPARLREDLQSLAQDGAYTAIWSPWIIAEVNRTLTWHYPRLSAPEYDGTSYS
jgi:predicted nucleic acid-binding protein